MLGGKVLILLYFVLLARHTIRQAADYAVLSGPLTANSERMINVIMTTPYNRDILAAVTGFRYSRKAGIV